MQVPRRRSATRRRSILRRKRGCVASRRRDPRCPRTAVGVEWYKTYGTDVDLAALNLCRLRRAGAGLGGSIEHGDEAVRRVLDRASPQALTWIASRAISYMDENGFPDAVSPWFPETPGDTS